MNKNHNSLAAKHIMKWELKNIPYAYFANNTPIYKDCWVDKNGEFKYLVEAWRPMENANQLMMIIKKMVEDSKEVKEGHCSVIHLNLDDGRWHVTLYYPDKNCTHDIIASVENENLATAVIEASLQAIEEAKGVDTDE